MRAFFATGEGYKVSKIEVRNDPGSGGYQTSRRVGPGEQLRSGSVESLSLSVDEVLV